MKLDYSDIGWGIFIACLGVGFLVKDIADADRRKACDARGGALVKSEEGWASEKACVVPLPAVKP